MAVTAAISGVIQRLEALRDAPAINGDGVFGASSAMEDALVAAEGVNAPNANDLGDELAEVGDDIRGLGYKVAAGRTGQENAKAAIIQIIAQLTDIRNRYAAIGGRRKTRKGKAKKIRKSKKKLTRRR